MFMASLKSLRPLTSYDTGLNGRLATRFASMRAAPAGTCHSTAVFSSPSIARKPASGLVFDVLFQNIPCVP